MPDETTPAPIDPDEVATAPDPEPAPTLDGIGGDEAPKRSRTKRKRSADKAPAKRPPGRPRSAATYAKELEPIVAMIGGGLFTVGAGSGNERLAWDGQHIMGKAEEIATAWGELATTNPAVARAITSLTQGSQFTGVAMVMAATLIPIAANHGLLPAGAASTFGAEIPERPAGPFVMESGPVVDASDIDAAFLGGAGGPHPVG